MCSMLMVINYTPWNKVTHINKLVYSVWRYGILQFPPVERRYPLGSYDTPELCSSCH